MRLTGMKFAVTLVALCALLFGGVVLAVTYAASGYLPGWTAGTQVSSTNEGRYIVLLESGMVHPTHTDGFVNKGDPVIYGNIVGVAMNSAAAATDYIEVDTEGIWNLTVTGTYSDGTAGGGNSTVAIGDALYIDASAATISKQNDEYNNKPFGFALGPVVAGASTVIAVKVHWDPFGTDAIFGQVGEFSTPLLIDVSAVGDAGQNEVAWRQGYVSSSSIIEADEQLMGTYIRVNNSTATDAGTTNAAHFKVVQDATNTTQLAHAVGIKANVDLRGEGAIHQTGIEILVEGAGTASASRQGIRFISRDTDGTLEACMQFETGTTFDLLAVTTNPSDTGTCYQIPVNIAGTIYYLLAYNTTGAA